MHVQGGPHDAQEHGSVRSLGKSEPPWRPESRRDRCGGVAAAVVPGSWALAEAPAATGRKVLVFLKVCDLPPRSLGADKLAELQKAIVALGRANGFDVTVTTDGAALEESRLSPFHLVVFYTTGNLAKEAGEAGERVTPSGREALLKAIVAGRGLVVMHCGLRPKAAQPIAGAGATPAGGAEEFDVRARVLADLQLLSDSLPDLRQGKPCAMRIADQYVRTAGESLGGVPLPLHMVALQTGADQDARPVFTLMSSTTSPLLKAILQCATPA
jgi:hypothetical protein